MQQLWSEMLLLEGLSVDLFELVTNTRERLRKFKTASGTWPEEGMKLDGRGRICITTFFWLWIAETKRS
jgi:hypothetical protein